MLVRAAAQTIAEFSRSLDPQTDAMMFFSGHGIDWRGKLYLVPKGAPPLKDQLG